MPQSCPTTTPALWFSVGTGQRAYMFYKLYNKKFCFLRKLLHFHHANVVRPEQIVVGVVEFGMQQCNIRNFHSPWRFEFVAVAGEHHCKKGEAVCYAEWFKYILHICFCDFLLYVIYNK